MPMQVYADDIDACSPNNEIDYQLLDNDDVTTVFTIAREVEDDNVKGVLKVCQILCVHAFVFYKNS